MRLPSASQIGRAIHCPASVALPQLDITGPDAEWGQCADSYVQRCREVGRDKALAEITNEEYRARCDGIDVTGIPAGAEAQVTIAWNPKTGKSERVKMKVFRAYPDDGRFWGTFDWVGMLDPKTAMYDDTKTGEPCAAIESWQLKSGGLFVARLVGVDRVRVGHRKLGWNGRWYPDRVDLGMLDLELAEGALKHLAEEVEAAHATVARGETPVVHDGPWCQYCPAQRRCPSRMALIRTASMGDVVGLAKFSGASAEDLKAFAAAQLAEMSPEEVGQAYPRVHQLLGFLTATEEAIKDIARVAPVPLEGGKELREVERAVTVVSATAALAALVPVVGEEVAGSTLKTSQTAIEEALKSKAPRGKLASMKREVMAKIDEIGGLKKVSRTEVRVVPRKPT